MLLSVAAPAGRTVAVEVGTANNAASITTGMGNGALGVDIAVVDVVGATGSAASVTASTARRVHASREPNDVASCKLQVSVLYSISATVLYTSPSCSTSTTVQ